MACTTRSRRSFTPAKKASSHLNPGWPILSRVPHPFAHFPKGWGIAHRATSLLHPATISKVASTGRARSPSATKPVLPFAQARRPTATKPALHVAQARQTTATKPALPVAQARQTTATKPALHVAQALRTTATKPALHVAQARRTATTLGRAQLQLGHKSRVEDASILPEARAQAQPKRQNCFPSSRRKLPVPLRSGPAFSRGRR
jgi:hypothetical protein